MHALTAIPIDISTEVLTATTVITTTVIPVLTVPTAMVTTAGIAEVMIFPPSCATFISA